MSSSGSLRISSMEECKKIAANWLRKQIDADMLFECAVCYSAINVDHPIHCPQCAKLFCITCLDGWFTTKGPRTLRINVKCCPCCRARLHWDQLSQCRLYQDVRQMVDGLRNNTGQLITQLAKPTVLCETHGKELILFCEDCRECICVKCVLVGGHREHQDQVLELDEAREKLKTAILGENSFLVHRLAVLNGASASLAKRENELHRSYEATVNELYTAVEAIVDRMHYDKKEKIKKLIPSLKAETLREQREVEAIMQKSTDLINAETSPGVIVETYQMIQDIKKMHNEYPVDPVELPDAKFINPLTPPPLQTRFSVSAFMHRIVRSCTVFSLPQSFEGYMLQLKGYHDADENMIKLSLRVLEGYDVNYIKVICYPKQQGEPLVRYMDLKKGEDNTMLEFDNFAAMGGFLDRTLDELVLDMKLSLWSTYYDLCAHKDWYIKKLSGLREIMDDIQKSG